MFAGGFIATCTGGTPVGGSSNNRSIDDVVDSDRRRNNPRDASNPDVYDANVPQFETDYNPDTGSEDPCVRNSIRCDTGETPGEHDAGFDGSYDSGYDAGHDSDRDIEEVVWGNIPPVARACQEGHERDGEKQRKKMEDSFPKKSFHGTPAAYFNFLYDPNYVSRFFINTGATALREIERFKQYLLEQARAYLPPSEIHLEVLKRKRTSYTTSPQVVMANADLVAASSIKLGTKI